MRHLLAVALLPCAIAVSSCSVPEQAEQEQPQPQETAAAPAVPAWEGAGAGEITSELVPIAAEFRGRLSRYSGTLETLRAEGGTIRATWSSQDCPMAEGEVIDFLISIHRGHPADLTQDIEAQRTCGGTTQHFELSATRFQQYRTGQINDPDVLQGLR